MGDERGEPALSKAVGVWAEPGRFDILSDIQAAIERMKATETKEQYLFRVAEWRAERLFFARVYSEPTRQEYIDYVETTAKVLGLAVS